MKVEGRLGGKFLLRNYLKRILSASEQQDTRGVVWGGELGAGVDCAETERD